jgi:hypothetical protein
VWKLLAGAWECMNMTLRNHRHMRTLGKLVGVGILFAGNMALTAPASAQGLFGPGKFKIEQTDDRFSDAPTITFMGLNNRISKKSPAGGIYINGQGLYLEPLVMRNRADGKIARVGFFFHNETEIDTTYGSPNSIGVPQNIVFLIDGSKRVSASLVQGGSAFGDGIQHNPISRSASSSLRETGLAYVSLEDMEAIAHARTIAIKIEGGRRATTFYEKDIAKTFLANLAMFYTDKVAR